MIRTLYYKIYKCLKYTIKIQNILHSILALSFKKLYDNVQLVDIFSSPKKEKEKVDIFDRGMTFYCS